MKQLKIIVQGLDRDERNRIIRLIRDVMKNDNYSNAGGNSPMEGDVSSIHFLPYDKSKEFDDMSIKACLNRYDNSRNKILKAIEDRRTSASMSGIENYRKPSNEITIEDIILDPFILPHFTWNGYKHIERPKLFEEFVKWIKNG